MKTLFHGISVLYGTQPQGVFKRGGEMQQLDSMSDAFMLVEDGIIVKLGTVNSEEFQQLMLDNIPQKHLNGAEVLPGFVDSHTHIVFAAPRHEEFELRLKGATYEEIAANGGGILNSAAKLGAMSEDELYHQAAQRLNVMISHGTTCVEIKSGYGLTPESELKMLRVIRRLKENFPIIIKSTFLGAHAFPANFKENREGYMQQLLEEMLPMVVEQNLADHMDVFCDKGFFDPEQTDRLLKAASAAGIPAKIHANELGITGGVQVAVNNGAWSADHLEHCDIDEIAALKRGFEEDYGGTMPVGLPGTSYFLGIPYTPVKRLMQEGLPVALATDFNPGSSPIASLQLVWALACTQMKMLPIEAFHAITCNAARAMRLEQRVGSLAVGMRADFLVTNTLNAVKAIPYFAGQNHIAEVYVNGVLFK